MIVNKIKIEDSEFDYEIKDNTIFLDNNPFKIEILKRFANDYYELLVNGKKLILGFKKSNNNIFINHKNRTFEAELIDNFTLMKKQMTQMTSNASSKTTVKAPMPGLVIKINKEVNEKVQKGDTILIIEAMKMENAIKSPKDGILSSIKVSSGNSVAKNDVLFEVE